MNDSSEFSMEKGLKIPPNVNDFMAQSLVLAGAAEVNARRFQKMQVNETLAQKDKTKQSSTVS